MLYVSIWKVTLSNLSATNFTRRSLSDGEAAGLIADARADRSLMGVSSDDLVAPYKKHSYNLHVEVCHALRARGVELEIEDFFNESYCNPLHFARVSPGHRLLVVDCGFEFNSAEARVVKRLPALTQTKEQEMEKVSSLFKVSPESFEFHLFEESAR